MIYKTNGTVSSYHWKIFEPWSDVVTIALTTRNSGSSTGRLKGLNLGHAVGDSIEALTVNRAEVQSSMGIEDYYWSIANQVHGCTIATASVAIRTPHPETDAIKLNQPGIIAAVMLADCHPVVLYDPARHAGLVCHAGWKGSAAGIAETAVESMLQDGSNVSDILAATGPGIGPCCYQIGNEVKERFESGFVYPDHVFSQDSADSSKWRLNIEAANLARLRSAGIKEANIGSGGFCTACRIDEFYSYRKEKGLTGRQVAMMALI